MLKFLFLGLLVHICVFSHGNSVNSLQINSTFHAEPLEWWQETIIYQIYPRSHKDSGDDGIGDIVGIEQTLDYIDSLGVKAVWISPIYKSPMVDFGYDISDFKDIEPIFGNLEQFGTMAASMRAKGIKLVMDFVPNHSSDQHEWFQKSIKKEDPYTDYYVWRDASGRDEDGNPLPPNNWVCVFRGSAWEWNEERGQFYLHQFVKEQPDLNFENPLVLQEMLDAMKFWLDLGVDGFRVDAVPHMFESQDFEDEPVNPDRDPSLTPEDYGYYLHPYTFNLPGCLTAMTEFRKLLDEYSERDGNQRVLMLEATVWPLEELFKYYGTPERPIAHFPFNFQLIGGVVSPVNAESIYNILEYTYRVLPEWGWANWLTGNHDNKRVVGRIGDQNVDAYNMLLLLLPGTAVTYYGEEIGMDDKVLTWEETVDPAVLYSSYPYCMHKEINSVFYMMNSDATQDLTYIIYFPGTLPGHQCNGTPVKMQVSRPETTWLPVNENYATVNVAAQTESAESHIKVYRQISELRKSNAWKYGGLEFRSLFNGQVFGFTRILEDGNGLLILMNFADTLITVNAATSFGKVSPTATVVCRNVGFVPTTTVIGSTVTTVNIVLGARSSLIVELVPETNTPTTTENNPPTTTENNPPTTTENNPPTTTENNPPTTTENNPPTTTENNPPTTTENNPPTTTENNPPTTTENNPPTTTENNPPTTTENFSPETKINGIMIFMGIFLNIMFFSH